MIISRRTAVLGTIFAPVALKAQDAPATLKIISGFAAGGTLDPVARLVADALGKTLYKQALVEAMPGASGRLAGEFVQKANDNGTILIANIASMLLTPLTMKDTKYDPRKDFIPLSFATEFQIALSVSKASGIQNLKSLIDYVKANPEKASYGIPAVGSLPHLLGLELEKIAGVKLTAVPYKGTAQIATDLSGGHLLLGITGTTDVAELHKAGALKTLGVTGLTRNPTQSDVPTFAQSGIKGLESNGWQGFFAPLSMPKKQADDLTNAITKALREGDAGAKLSQLGYHIIAQDGAAMQAKINSDYAKYAPLIAASGVGG
jgi:tripartite-type tricarboxylate transporter receptor subunit TctC